MSSLTRRTAFASSLTLVFALLLSLVSVPAAHAAGGSDATLGSLTISTGALDPAFDPAVTTYSVTVPFTTTAFSFTATTADAAATITTWNGEVTAGAASGIPTNATLRLGMNILIATVASADASVTTSYMLLVTREAPPLPAYDPRLNALSVSEGDLTPAFDPAVTAYSVEVPYTTSSITFAAASSEPTVTITNLGRGTTGNTTPLIIGGNAIQIRVTAPDGTTTRDYNVQVTRAPQPTADVDLASIVLSDGTLTPAFDPAVTNYSVSVPYAVRTMQIGATAYVTDNTVRINNVEIAAGATMTVSVNFDPIGSSFSIRVTAPNGFEKSYNVTVIRDQPSNNADLTGLSLSTGTLSPVFANGETDYTATVPYLTTSVQVTGELADPTAILRVNGVDTLSDAASAPIAIPVGSTPIIVTATAEDGVTVTSRTITATREAPILDLSALSITDATLSPAFDAGTVAYTLQVPYLTSSIDVAAAAAESGWEVAINGVAGGSAHLVLPVGDTTVTVTVTALYGESQQYTVVVTRLPAPPAAIAFDLGFEAGDTAAGAELHATAQNLLPGSTATVTLYSTPIVLGSALALGDATLSLDARLPASVPAGAHRLVLDGTALDGTPASATVWFTVLRDGTIGAVSLTGPVAYTETALAPTGADGAAPLAALAALLAAAGLLLLRGSRRARRSAA